VPTPVSAVILIVLSALAALLGGYLAPHTARPDLFDDPLVEQRPMSDKAGVRPSVTDKAVQPVATPMSPTVDPISGEPVT
jgi:hypothetical protein